MPADMRDVLHDAAARDEDGPDVDAILARAGRLRARRRVVAAGVAVAVPLAVLAAVVLPGRVDVGLVDRPAASVLEVPTAEEQVAAAFLDDGTPVFVSNLGEDGVAVLDARVPYQPIGDGVDVLALWCPSAGLFAEAPGESAFAPDGQYRAGPAPSGLVPYRVEQLDSRHVRVGERASALPRPTDAAAGAQSARQGLVDCGGHEASAGQQARWHYAEHAARAPSPQEALESTEDGRVVVWGTLEYVGAQPPRLCEHTDVGRREPIAVQCAEHEAVATSLPARQTDAADLLWGYPGVLVLDVQGGEVTHVTVGAVVGEYGGSFRGERTLRGTLIPSDASPGSVSVLGDPEERRRPDLYLQVDDSEPAGLWLTDEVAVTGRSMLAGSDDPRPVPVERVFAAAADGEPVRLDVTVRNRDGVITRIEEVPSGTGEHEGVPDELPPAQEPGQPDSEQPPVEGGPSAPEEDAPEPLTDIEHGGQYWAVLWVGASGDPEPDRIRDAIDERWGPVWSDGDLACDRGAAEALGADPTARRVAVYFSTEADARQFTEQAALPSQPAGYTEVTTYCLD